MADYVFMLQLRRLRTVRLRRRSLGGREDAMQRFLDYCNTSLHEIGDSLLTKLQTVQDTTARVVTGLDHNNPVCTNFLGFPSAPCTTAVTFVNYDL